MHHKICERSEKVDGNSTTKNQKIVKSLKLIETYVTINHSEISILIENWIVQSVRSQSICANFWKKLDQR